MTEAHRTSDDRAKGLTIWQPYAEMIIRREKLVENRTWATNYRGMLYIHAGKSRQDWDAEIDGKRYPNAAFGAIVGVCRLVDCVRSADAVAGKPDTRYPWISKHPHVHGPWCWVLEGAAPIGPWPRRGAQGLFDIDGAEVAAYSSQPQRQSPQASVPAVGVPAGPAAPCSAVETKASSDDCHPFCPTPCPVHAQKIPEVEMLRRQESAVNDLFKPALKAPVARADCKTCSGYGMVGGFVSPDSGYQSDPCPDCSPVKASEEQS